jgi:amino acid transporter/nucleotide-binding universal stress UspA family protein
VAEEITSNGPAAAGVETGLSRDLGLLHVTMIGVGAMIGAGIFVLTGIAAGEAGPALVLVFLLNGLVTTLTALSYAELGSCFPEAGGGYLWVKEALPQPTGFLSGWMSWFAHAVACSLYAIAFGAFASEILGMTGVSIFDILPLPLLGAGPEDTSAKYLAVLVVFLFTYINYRGAEETGLAETAVTVLKMVIIAGFLGFGLWAIFTHASRADWPGHFIPFMPRGWAGVITAMGLTFIAFEGYEIIAQCGEEVKDPKRNIPRSIFLSLAIVVPIYVLVAFVALAAVVGDGMPSWQVLGLKGELAMVEAAEEFMPFGKLIFLIGGLFSTMSALNATIYSSSRVSFAMGRDHNLPTLLGQIHPLRRTPHWATIISGVFIVIMAVALPIEDVASATDVMFLLLFLLVNISVINLRRNRPDLDRGFTVPFMPFLPLLAAGINLFLAGFLFFYSPTGIIICAGYIAAGVSIYYIYSRGKEREAKATPVLLHEVPVSPAEDFRVLVPVANPRTCAGLVELGTRLTVARQGDLVLLNVIRVPAQLPPRAGRRFLDSARDLLSCAHETADGKVPLHGVVRIGHNVARAIIETAQEKGVDLLVLGWEGSIKRRDRAFGTVLDELILNASCDVAVVRRASAGPVKKILVPVVGIETAQLSLRIAAALHDVNGEPITLLHITRPGSEERARERLQAELDAFEDIDVDAFEIRVEPLGRRRRLDNAILRATEGYDLIIMGAPQEGLVRRAMFGDVPESVAKQVKIPVILTKRYTGAVKSWFQQLFGSRKTFLD